MSRQPRSGDRRPWKHGYQRYAQGRGWTFYIRQTDHRGVRHDVSTGIVDDERLADAEFQRWQELPNAYDYRDRKTGDALILTGELIARYCGWLGLPKEQGGKGDSPDHVKRQKSLLGWWQERLDGLNLRTVELKELESLCPPGPGIRHRRIAIKSFLKRLRKWGELARSEGPEEDLFEVPPQSDMYGQGRANRLTKGADAQKGWAEVRKVIEPHWRAALDVLAGTGWHVSELARWVREYRVEPLPVGREHEGAAVLVTVHKSKREHRTIVSDQCLAAALKFKAWNETRVGVEVQGSQFDQGSGKYKPVKRTRSEFPLKYFYRMIRRAVKRSGAPASFGAGHLRHGIATLAASEGLNTVREFLGHAKGSKMLERHYVDPAAQASKPTAKVIELPRKVATLV